MLVTLVLTTRLLTPSFLGFYVFERIATFYRFLICADWIYVGGKAGK